MEQGLNGAGNGLYYTKNKIKQNNKNYPVGEKQDSWQGLTRQDKTRPGRTGTGYIQGNINDELARDCKHKEIIKGANEVGNETNTGGAN